MKLKCETCRQPFDPQGKKVIKYANRIFCCEDHKRQFVEAHEKYFGRLK